MPSLSFAFRCEYLKMDIAFDENSLSNRCIVFLNIFMLIAAEV